MLWTSLKFIKYLNRFSSSRIKFLIKIKLLIFWKKHFFQNLRLALILWRNPEFNCWKNAILDSRKFACGTFVVPLWIITILLKKLKYCGIFCTSKSCFKSYLDNRKQLVLLNGNELETQIMENVVPQASGGVSLFKYFRDCWLVFSETRGQTKVGGQ